MIVIGTAGHIDHGKSSIIIRLTGIDPDRLPEEKARGMTIDLGFAWYDTSDGKRIGIVDVPGHERFVRNMIAGAGGIDAVLLVVAADDGWMPQTQEHLQITKLLGIKYGIIVISKIDLADRYWVEMVEEDIRARLKGTFLADAPVVKASAVSGEGIPRLREEIEKLAGKIMERENILKPRLYIDRSFVLSGLGGVATGTLRGGTLSAGQEIAIFPSRRKGKIRTIQSHNNQVETAQPGQRTAITFTGLDKDYIIRGGVVTTPQLIETYPDSPVLAVNLKVIEESPFPLEDKRRLLMILGTTEVEGELRLTADSSLFPGQSDLAFFRPYGPILAFIGDRFIFRLPTPQVTVGGGEILGFLDNVPKKKDYQLYEYLTARINLTPENLVRSEILRLPLVNLRKSLLHSNLSQAEMTELVARLIESGFIKEYNGLYFRPEEMKALQAEILIGMKNEFDKRPHIDGLQADQIAHILNRKVLDLETVLELMTDGGILARKKNRYDLPGRIITVTGELKQAADEIEKRLIAGKYAPPSIDDLTDGTKIKRDAFDYLVNIGQAVKVTGGLAFHRSHWNEIIAIIRNTLDRGEALTVASLREKLGNSRKYAVPILEETDRINITERQGDIRIKGKKYDQK
ncbi:putative Selenocysteine-specific elongation factor [Candidatus Zixiibacteriota bacterium]|nr:putative Selenocysteine-specific elongation factor [candidate division Zixibacteria bacterium]